MKSFDTPHEAELDLVLERIVDVPREAVWKAWTIPARLMQWFTPVPWKTVACEIDLRPGGVFSTTMQSPEGQLFPNLGCYLEVIENERLVWTNSLGPGFRPLALPSGQTCGDLYLTAILTLASTGKGTRYTARALHGDTAGRGKHEAMGFAEGWGTALDQLVAMVKAS
ncbi:MAG: SRPBCC family protein [Steroidobacteraceae bacterium]